MTQLDSQKLKQLMADKKWLEAESLLKDYLNQPLTDEEKGRAYADFILMYSQVEMALLKDYDASLANMLSVLKGMKEKEKESLKNLVK